MTVMSKPSSSEQTIPLLLRQVAAIDVWTRTRRDQQQTLLTEPISREGRLDAARQLEALDRAHASLVARLDLALAADVGALQASTAPRAVLAHRHEWFVQKLAEALTELGIRVLAVLDNGADAVGAVVAEQPELLLVEEALPMLTGQQVIAETAFFSPATLAVVQVSQGDRVGSLLDAGARMALTRQVPPADVAAQMVALLDGHR